MRKEVLLDEADVLECDTRIDRRAGRQAEHLQRAFQRMPHDRVASLA